VSKATALTSVLLLALSLAGDCIYFVAAESDQDDATVNDPPTRLGGWMRRNHFLEGLDEEQRQELMETIDSMRDEGATQEEIREYIQAYLEELGIEYQEPSTTRPQLTDEQLEGLEQLRAEVEELIKQRLEELGIDESLAGDLPGFSLRGRMRHNNDGS